MGAEAQCRCRWSGGEAQVKALLEARELILRGGLKRTIPVAAIKVAVDGEDLVICADDTYRLALGAGKAARWKTKIETPPPTLKAKLGLGDTDRAWVIGAIDDAALGEAVEGAVSPALQARVAVAQIASAAQLAEVLAAYGQAGLGLPLWLVYAKGPKAAFGDNAVRAVMRGAGFIDSKSCAVSETCTATRYARR